MSIETVAKWFEIHFRNEFQMFARIDNPGSDHEDMHAFLLLDRIFGGKGPLVTAVKEDGIILFPTPEQIAKLTESDVIELIRCGVMYDEEEESLYMF